MALTQVAGGMIASGQSIASPTFTGTSTFTGGVANAYGFGVGTAVPSSGAGITFPATQSASTDANTLDDYEEGTWTPTVIATGGGTATYSAQSGYYIKIGSLVSVWFQVNYGRGTLSGGLGIGNLPFATASISNVYSSAAIGYWGLQSTITLMVNHIAQNGGTSNTNIRIANGGSTQMGTAMNAGDVATTNSNTFIMQWSYQATS